MDEPTEPVQDHPLGTFEEFSSDLFDSQYQDDQDFNTDYWSRTEDTAASNQSPEYTNPAEAQENADFTSFLGQDAAPDHPQAEDMPQNPGEVDAQVDEIHLEVDSGQQVSNSPLEQEQITHIEEVEVPAHIWDQHDPHVTGSLPHGDDIIFDPDGRFEVSESDLELDQAVEHPEPHDPGDYEHEFPAGDDPDWFDQ